MDKRLKDNSGVITGNGDAASASTYLPLIAANYQRGHNGLMEARGQRWKSCSSGLSGSRFFGAFRGAEPREVDAQMEMAQRARRGANSSISWHSKTLPASSQLLGRVLVLGFHCSSRVLTCGFCTFASEATAAQAS